MACHLNFFLHVYFSSMSWELRWNELKHVSAWHLVQCLTYNRHWRKLLLVMFLAVIPTCQLTSQKLFAKNSSQLISTSQRNKDIMGDMVSWGGYPKNLWVSIIYSYTFMNTSKYYWKVSLFYAFFRRQTVCNKLHALSNVTANKYFLLYHTAAF